MVEGAQKIILVRHGATTVDGRPQVAGGKTNVPLSEKGHAQALSLDCALNRTPITVVMSSHLDRAYDTALPVASSRGLAVVRNPLVGERVFGKIEDATDPAQQEAYRAQLRTFWRLPPAERIDKRLVPDMETDRSLLQRLGEFFSLFDVSTREGAAAVVTHWDVISTFLLHQTDKLYSPKNTGRVELLARGGDITIIDMHDIDLVVH